MRTKALTSNQPNTVKTQEVKKGITSFLTLQNAAITAFVVGLLSGAASIALWQVGGINPWITCSLAGVGALLLMGVAIATVVSCCKKQGAQTQKQNTTTATAKPPNAAPLSKAVVDPTSAAVKDKILADIQNPATNPQEIIDAIKKSGTKEMGAFLQAAINSDRFDLVSAFLTHFKFAISLLCTHYSAIDDDHKNAKMAIEIHLGVQLHKAFANDEDSIVKLILETLPTLDTHYLEKMFEADAKKCVQVFLSLYPQQIEQTITTRMLQNPNVKDQDGMLELVCAHNLAVKEKEVPKTILRLIKDDQNKDELIKVMKDNNLRPNKLINDKMIILWAAEAGSLEIVKALVVQLGNLPIFPPLDYLDSTPLTPEIRQQLQMVMLKA